MLQKGLHSCPASDLSSFVLQLGVLVGSLVNLSFSSSGCDLICLQVGYFGWVGLAGLFASGAWLLGSWACLAFWGVPG